jgi:hypothetical protein
MHYYSFHLAHFLDLPKRPGAGVTHYNDDEWLCCRRTNLNSIPGDCLEH